MILLEYLSTKLTPLGARPQRMISGMGFMLNGNLVIGTRKTGLIVRVGMDNEAKATKMLGATVKEMRGKVMRGWIRVELEGCKSEAQVDRWLTMALAFNKTLPPKGAIKKITKKNKAKS